MEKLEEKLDRLYEKVWKKLYDIDCRLTNIENRLLAQKTVLTLDEVAAYTGMSKSHLYKLTFTCGIPCYKPQGKHIYFNKQEIDQWLLQNKKENK